MGKDARGSATRHQCANNKSTLTRSVPAMAYEIRSSRCVYHAINPSPVDSVDSLQHERKKKERNESIRHTHGSIGRAAALFFFFFRLLIALFVIIIIHQRTKENKKKKERKGERRANALGTTPYAVYGGARAGKHLNLTTTLRECRC